jgi:hypothetical protein
MQTRAVPETPLIRKVLKTIVPAVMLCCLPASRGHGDNSSYHLYGAGKTSCAQWLKFQTEDPCSYYQQLGWLAGWVSAVGYHGVARMKYADPETTSKYIDDYCGKNPHDSLQAAARAFVMSLQR